ncbi:MAG: hypothetical protein CMH56_14905 [Myxococcales bacterium]|nr:hypothetical protein [Myxococcales bacterium]|tara:strand:+ start:1566 stop:2111 length:546 start_codon:yes stop_codon:yes gene_type:complete
MIRINLLPIRAKRKRNTSLIHLSVFGSSIFVSLMLMGAWNSTYDGDLDMLIEEIELKKEEKIRYEKIIEEVETLKREEKTLRDQLGVIEKLERGRRGPVFVLDELATIIPKRVWLDSVTEARNVLELSGFGIENADISEFMKALDKSRFFSKITLAYTKASDQEGISIYSFQITCLVDYAA